MEATGRKGVLKLVEGTMDGKKYRKVVRKEVMESASILFNGSSFVFQQDNATPHTARRTKSLFARRHVKVMKWPAQSPDMNPIEHVWRRLKTMVWGRKPTTMEELITCIHEEWDKLDENFIKKLVEGMPRRVTALAKARGRNTKY